MIAEDRGSPATRILREHEAASAPAPAGGSAPGQLSAAAARVAGMLEQGEVDQAGRPAGAATRWAGRG
jgi:hypothetical protein